MVGDIPGSQLANKLEKGYCCQVDQDERAETGARQTHEDEQFVEIVKVKIKVKMSIPLILFVYSLILFYEPSDVRAYDINKREG
jgi:hypothetical protein